MIEELKKHQYGLILIKTPLYWYDTKSVDQVESRVVILLDVQKSRLTESTNGVVATETACKIFSHFNETLMMDVIINGEPHRMWTHPKDFDILNENR